MPKQQFQAYQDAARDAEEERGRLLTHLQQQTHLLNLAHFLVRDMDDRITCWNRGAQTLYGWTEAEAMGQLSHALLHTEFTTPLEDIETELRQQGEWQGELVHTRKDGTRMAVASHWALYRDAAGWPVAVLEVNNDITELRLAREALKETDRRKDEFLATLSHELRNPLAPIRNALYVLRRRCVGDSVVEQMAAMLERQVGHMVRLVDDLLDVSRISRAKIELRKGTVDLAAVVRHAVEAVRPFVEGRRHSLEVSLPAEVLRLDADAARLEQVVANLLTNACKYTEPGGRITLQVNRLDGVVQLRVRDTGIGIRAEMLTHIFEMFAQGDHVAGQLPEGLGIGLTLVRSLVEMHGGTVQAFSDGPGKGSEFVVRLPLAEEPGTVTDPASGDENAVPTGRPLRVLIVEDNEDGAEALATLLLMDGHHVRVAHDGPAGLVAADSFHPEVVLLDIGMPGMDGYEMARHLHERLGAEPLLVALTGYGQAEDRRRSGAAGFAAHLVKPVEPAVLRELLHQVQDR